MYLKSHSLGMEQLRLEPRTASQSSGVQPAQAPFPGTHYATAALMLLARSGTGPSVTTAIRETSVPQCCVADWGRPRTTSFSANEQQRWDLKCWLWLPVLGGAGPQRVVTPNITYYLGVIGGRQAETLFREGLEQSAQVRRNHFPQLGCGFTFRAISLTVARLRD